MHPPDTPSGSEAQRSPPERPSPENDQLKNEPPENQPTENRSPDDWMASSGLRDWADALRDVAPYLDLGWRVAGAAAVPPTLGYGVDAWAGTLPWGVVVGAVAGLAAAVVQLRRLDSEMEARTTSARRPPDADTS